MTERQYKKVIKLVASLRKIKTWTAEKKSILAEIVDIMSSGVHDRFTSHYRIHGKYVGLFYLNNNTHQRRGALQKYRGKSIMVLCYKRGIGQSRFYIVSTIDGDIEIRKTNQTKINQGWQPNILKWRISITGEAVE
jgi:hypothetical protein